MSLEAYIALLENRRAKLRSELEPIFSQPAEFVCEIGCGHGHFLTAYAAAHRRQVCVGLDLVGERVARARRKRERAALDNLHFFQAEARLFLEVLPASARISTVFILFPDPWPKLRHRKHRIVQALFLDMLAARSTPDCRLYFRTDYRPYYQESCALFQRHPYWSMIEEAWPFEYETVFQQRAGSFFSIVAALQARARDTFFGCPMPLCLSAGNFEG